MAVAYNSAGAGGTGSKNNFTGGAVSASWSHTCSGTERAAIVLGKFHTSSALTSASITITATYGGVSMTSLGSVMHNNGTGDKVEMFYLLNPPTGAQTVTVSCTSSQVNRGCLGTSLAFTGVKAVSAATVATNYGSTGTATVATPGHGNGMVVGIGSFSDPNGGMSFSSIAADSVYEGTRGATLLCNRGAASVTISVSQSGTSAWGAIGASLIGDQPFFGMF